MVGMSVDGLVSGLDTTSLISRLVQAEGAPQAALKTRLSVAQAAAVAYRSVNTRLDALRTAAEALLKPEVWNATTVTAPAGVSVTTSSATKAGSVTFDVLQTAATHVVRSATTWASASDLSGYTALDVLDAAGAVKGTITIPNKATLAQTVDAINASGLGLTAAVVAESGQYKIEVTAGSSGQAAAFNLRNQKVLTGTGAPDFTAWTQGQDAQVKVGSTTVVSATNDFTTLLAGTTIRVSEPKAGLSVTVSTSPDAVVAKVQALVDAANSALSGIRTHSDPKGGAAAVLKGDSALRAIVGRVLTAVSSAVGADGSAGAAGLQLDRNGSITFDKDVFLTAVAADPAKVQRTLAGTAAAGPDGRTGTGDDGVPGVAQRLADLAKVATDTTSGTLTMLANGRDNLAKDLQRRIEAWDLRLAARRDTLTRQFSAMETALSGLNNRSTWLAGQLSSLSGSM